MKRQKIRKTIIFISALLFPITMFYYSPYIIIHAAIDSIICGSFIVFGCMLLLSIFFGRIFCGYLCAGAGLGEMAGYINANPPKLGKRKYIKYVIWVIWLAIIIFLFINNGGIKAIDPLYGTTNGISVTSAPEYIVYYVVVFLLFGLPLLFGKRAFCHYLCWMAPFMNIGMKIRELLHIPGLRLNVDKDKCIRCNRCTTQCPMGLKVQEMIIEGTPCQNECSMCGACIDVCPKKVISYGFTKKP